MESQRGKGTTFSSFLPIRQRGRILLRDKEDYEVYVDDSGENALAIVDINCAAIPENLLESELSGYEAGAFTDAKKRKGGAAISI